MTIGSRGPSVPVWDVATRFGHWAVAGLVAFAWWSATHDHMDWHEWAGYGVLFYIAFRIYWGLVGAETARFSRFVRGPRAILASLRTLPSRLPYRQAGHNPIGALSVLALLLTMIVLVVTGLFAVDIDGIESGPLSDRVDFDTGRRLAEWHHQSFTVLEGLVVLHLAAIVFYLLYKRTDLLGPMISGRGRVEGRPPVMASFWRALPGIVLAGALTWWVMHGLRSGFIVR